LDVNGDSDTRIRIDGSNTAGLFFTLGSGDAGTVRSAANGIEIWTNDKTLVLRLQGNQVTIFGDLHVTGTVTADGNSPTESDRNGAREAVGLTASGG
jgi:hypothetical protein